MLIGKEERLEMPLEINTSLSKNADNIVTFPVIFVYMERTSITVDSKCVVAS